MKLPKKTEIAIIFIFIIGLMYSFVYFRPHKSAEKKDLKTADKNFSRIISVTPSLTECVYALGCGKKIVGVGDFTRYPEEAALKPRVGGYINPNMEVITSLKPDLMLIQGEDNKLSAFCENNGIRYERFKIDNVGDIFTALEKLGTLLGAEKTSDSLRAEIKKGLAEITEKTTGATKLKVFYSLGHTPGNLSSVFTVGQNTFISELIRIAGGENICDDKKMLYPEMSKETLVMKAPDIILESLAQKENPSKYREKLVDDWKRLSTIPAVQNGRVVLLDEPALEIPGPRIVYSADYFAKLIHPELFK